MIPDEKNKPINIFNNAISSFSLAHRFLLNQVNDDHTNMEPQPPHHEAVKKPNGEGVGVGYGSGSGSGGGSGHGSSIGKGVGSGGSGYGSGEGSGIGSGIGGNGHGYEYGKGEEHGLGNVHGCVPPCVLGFTIPIPEIPAIPRIPEIPAIPQIPEIPAIPQIPEIPAIPQIPAIPKIPIIPVVPGCVTGNCVEGDHPWGPITDCNPGHYEGHCQPWSHHGQQTPEGSASKTANVMQEAINKVSEPYPPDEDHSQP
ncbi:elastin-like [Durio zibethinus]|uniref:Elastin-like n=1 Tax=Durio zibethinus TaxID=66656 RepID=A0A6P5WPD3_DURZI|nr:elastin-like [Durio zibethinus]